MKAVIAGAADDDALARDRNKIKAGKATSAEIFCLCQFNVSRPFPIEANFLTRLQAARVINAAERIESRIGGDRVNVLARQQAGQRVIFLQAAGFKAALHGRQLE